MGGWKTVFEDEVEGRLVTVKVYESKEPEDQHEAPAVRVTTTFLDAYEDALEPNSRQPSAHSGARGGRPYHHA